ncbi:MAG: UDP-N-acetylglucosamine 1-carboxyvinyltransferase [Alphaproteobacteria bacterium]|nr:UDP-N-acetylglucosamine 1-carboxyvinyltransferase [Alphaproteobacteria bacterium]
MDRLSILGNGPLEGRIPISGAKNSALKLMAAALLCEQPLVLTGMPNLADTRFMARLLQSLGVNVEWPTGEALCRMHAESVTSTIAPYDLVRKMRATFNVLGPLLARVGHATVSLPGGCAIGARPVDLHLKAFEAMGADIVIEEGYVKAAALRGLKGAHIVFPFVSVGATEHAMLAAVLAQGETILENAACEPEIADLANCLNTVGAKITGAGTPTIHIKGVAKLGGGRYDVIADRIEAGTYAIAAAATGGDVFLEGARGEDMGALIDSLQHAGVTVDIADKGIRIRRDGKALQAVDIDTRPHPGFPTDLQAQFMALMTIANGTSTIRENIFENRFMHAPELNRLGADITVRGSEAIVRGAPKLHGAQVMATDLRASVSLVIAALVAEGETMVNRVYHLDRGFERLEEKLGRCGAKIRRLDGSA